MPKSVSEQSFIEYLNNGEIKNQQAQSKEKKNLELHKANISSPLTSSRKYTSSSRRYQTVRSTTKHLLRDSLLFLPTQANEIEKLNEASPNMALKIRKVKGRGIRDKNLNEETLKCTRSTSKVHQRKKQKKMHLSNLCDQHELLMKTKKQQHKRSKFKTIHATEITCAYHIFSDTLHAYKSGETYCPPSHYITFDTKSKMKRKIHLNSNADNEIDADDENNLRKKNAHDIDECEKKGRHYTMNKKPNIAYYSRGEHLYFENLLHTIETQFIQPVDKQILEIDRLQQEIKHANKYIRVLRQELMETTLSCRAHEESIAQYIQQNHSQQKLENGKRKFLQGWKSFFNKVER